MAAGDRGRGGRGEGTLAEEAGEPRRGGGGASEEPEMVNRNVGSRYNKRHHRQWLVPRGRPSRGRGRKRGGEEGEGEVVANGNLDLRQRRKSQLSRKGREGGEERVEGEVGKNEGIRDEDRSFLGQTVVRFLSEGTRTPAEWQRMSKEVGEKSREEKGRILGERGKPTNPALCKRRER